VSAIDGLRGGAPLEGFDLDGPAPAAGAPPTVPEEAAAAARGASSSGRAEAAQAMMRCATAPSGPPPSEARWGEATSLGAPLEPPRPPRASEAEVAAAVRSIFAGVPELRGVDPRLLEMLVPARDMVVECRVTPGEGFVSGKIGRAMAANLGVPVDRPYTSVFRPQLYREKTPAGEELVWVYPETISIADGRAFREEMLYPWTAVRTPSGSTKLATSARIGLSREPTPVYTLTVAHVPDWRADPEIARIYSRSENLRALIGTTAPEKIQVLRANMDRPYELPGLAALGAGGDNILVLNEETGARMLVHPITLFRGDNPNLFEKLGKRVLPEEVFIWEVTGWRPTPRTDAFDPTRDPALRAQLPPGHAEAIAKIEAAPRAFTSRAAAAVEAVRRELKTGISDWKVTDAEAARALQALAGLEPAEWLAAIEKIRGKVLEKLEKRGIENDPMLREAIREQVRAKLGARSEAELNALMAVLALRA
jgi:hypothetical protein